ncbi:Laccase-1 [Nymphon striatum]|nr:Laccase-1 [Nymphon striatum]
MLLILAATATGASAHSKAEQTTPANDATVATVDAIEMRFDDPMRVTAITLTGPDGEVSIDRETGMDAVNGSFARCHLPTCRMEPIRLIGAAFLRTAIQCRALSALRLPIDLMEGLAPIDAWALAAIIAKAAGYGAALLAMGGPLFVLVFSGASADVVKLARKSRCYRCFDRAGGAGSAVSLRLVVQHCCPIPLMPVPIGPCCGRHLHLRNLSLPDILQRLSGHMRPDAEGRVPGPEIRLRAGERVGYRLVNDLPQPTAVHWHGIRIENAMDGAAPLTSSPSTAGGGDREPWLGETGAATRELVLILDDWLLDSDANIIEDRWEDLHAASHGGRMGNTVTFPHAIHLHGHHFTVQSQSGAANTEGDVRDTVLIGADETVEIAFVADNPGKWMIHCHMLSHQKSGMMAWFEVG